MNVKGWGFIQFIHFLWAPYLMDMWNRYKGFRKHPSGLTCTLFAVVFHWSSLSIYQSTFCSHFWLEGKIKSLSQKVLSVCKEHLAIRSDLCSKKSPVLKKKISDHQTQLPCSSPSVRTTQTVQCCIADGFFIALLAGGQRGNIASIFFFFASVSPVSPASSQNAWSSFPPSLSPQCAASSPPDNFIYAEIHDLITMQKLI